jgi:hypothetical protein
MSISAKKLGAMLAKQNQFLVNQQGSDIQICERVSHNPSTITLTPYGNNGKWYIQPPKYRFVSYNSFWDYVSPEDRMTRNKVTLSKFVEKLKKTGVWEHIENQEFIKINPHHHHFNAIKSKAQKQLSKLYS